ncbi:hypothetical protein ABT237_08780 [Streptomyces sp. NPDC001581]|uniref:hypothetical protein n=1 Tax=Streptomyces sp. NPDC001581 TaxID=3154386 RepID=UPI00332B6422
MSLLDSGEFPYLSTMTQASEIGDADERFESGLSMSWTASRPGSRRPPRRPPRRTDRARIGGCPHSPAPDSTCRYGSSSARSSAKARPPADLGGGDRRYAESVVVMWWRSAV